jgi:hypothetical protein
MQNALDAHLALRRTMQSSHLVTLAQTNDGKRAHWTYLNSPVVECARHRCAPDWTIVPQYRRLLCRKYMHLCVSTNVRCSLHNTRGVRSHLLPSRRHRNPWRVVAVHRNPWPTVAVHLIPCPIVSAHRIYVKHHYIVLNHLMDLTRRRKLSF